MLISPLIRILNAKPAKKAQGRNQTTFSIEWKVLLFYLFHWIFINVLIVSKKFYNVLAVIVSFVDCGIFQWSWRIFSKLVECPWKKLKKTKQQQQQQTNKNKKTWRKE